MFSHPRMKRKDTSNTLLDDQIIAEVCDIEKTCQSEGLELILKIYTQRYVTDARENQPALEPYTLEKTVLLPGETSLSKGNEEWATTNMHELCQVVIEKLAPIAEKNQKEAEKILARMALDYKKQPPVPTNMQHIQPALAAKKICATRTLQMLRGLFETLESAQVSYDCHLTYKDAQCKGTLHYKAKS